MRHQNAWVENAAECRTKQVWKTNPTHVVGLYRKTYIKRRLRRVSNNRRVSNKRPGSRNTKLSEYQPHTSYVV